MLLHLRLKELNKASGASSEALGVFSKEKENTMEDLIRIKVYDDDDKVIKEVEANIVDIRMGTIRKLFALAGIEEVEDMASMLKMVNQAWGSLTKILDKIFPNMTEDDWDGVKINELFPIVVRIVKRSLGAIGNIPIEKNVMGSQS